MSWNHRVTINYNESMCQSLSPSAQITIWGRLPKAPILIWLFSEESKHENDDSHYFVYYKRDEKDVKSGWDYCNHCTVITTVTECVIFLLSHMGEMKPTATFWCTMTSAEIVSLKSNYGT